MPRVKLFLNQKLTSYKKFMGIEKMPNYEIGINEQKQNGILVLASHNYNVNTDKHILKVSQDIYKKKNMEYILFHEFTHIYDVISYSARNPELYFANRGYTEYHASQIELLKLLGVDSINDNLSFSLKKSIETVFGNTTVLEYTINCRNGARQLISEVNFPDSLNSLLSVLGMIFNYLGRVSICRLYASDFELYRDELEDMDFEISYLGNYFQIITSIAKGFLDEMGIVKFGDLFSPMAKELYQKFVKNF